ncbi:phosphopantetheine-binding protein [Butyrivibrio sp. LC3010]|uniref:phosphopantetheine-binding protein n=1 Tax=Butyrivibrio sp. LC3010 TaxID=1280680 RepID=UPI0003FC91B7|nr:phosphopantetheine-binding protein [Butyrivibrio sp. LC3010]
MEERILKVIDGINEEIRDYKGDNLFEAGLLDSFQVIDLVNALEEEFDIEIDAKYVIEENFKTIEAIVSLMQPLDKWRT